jgi:hypothetical protein
MAQYAGSLTPPFDFGDFQDAEGHWDHEAHQKAESEWLEKVKADLRAKNKGDLVGETVKWSAADGYAVYMIVKQRPLTLKHIATGDAYQTNGATISEVEGPRRKEASRARSLLRRSDGW